MTESIPLCHRCEHRAVFLEIASGPRWECQQTFPVCSCYMYRPVIPLVLQKVKGDRRPLLTGTLFSARTHAVRLAKVRLRNVHSQGGTVLWQEPLSAAGCQLKSRPPDSRAGTSPNSTKRAAVRTNPGPAAAHSKRGRKF